MPYPRRLLNEGEEVALDIHPHWWFLAGRVATLIVVVLLGGVALGLSAPSWADDIWLVALALALLWLFVRYLRWTTTSLVVTSDRIILRDGILSRRGREIPLEHLNDISFHQSLFERMIGAGSLLFESAGRDSGEQVPCIPKPAEVQNEVYRRMNSARDRTPVDFHWQPGPAAAAAASAQPAANVSVADELERLDALRRRGVLTDQEFDQQKARLLDQR